MQIKYNKCLKFQKCRKKVNFQNLKTENTSVNAPALFVKTNFEPGVTAGLVPWFPGSRTLSFQGEEMHWNTFPVK